MREIKCDQQSEEWERWRNRPTASEAGKFCTAAKGQYSSQATSYAAKIVAKRLGVYQEPPQTYWMDWGCEMEPNARLAYETMTGATVREVGFILPDHTDAYGGSPDGLVDPDGMVEIKCPAPETLISYHAEGVLPVQYKPQIQMLLLISGRYWCDFFVFHPELTPFLLRVVPDVKYQEKQAASLLLLLEEIDCIELRVSKMNHKIISTGTGKSEVRWDE